MADCVLGVARLISSARQICVKIGPRWNSKNRLPSGVSMTMFVPRMSAGIRSGVNWMREKSQVERLGQRAHQQRLAQARHAFQQAMPADEQAGQHAVDDLVVADDDAADLLADRGIAAHELLGPLFHRFANAHAGVDSCVESIGYTRSVSAETLADTMLQRHCVNPYYVSSCVAGLIDPLRHLCLASHTFFLAFSSRSV